MQKDESLKIKSILVTVTILYGITMFFIGYFVCQYTWGLVMLENYENQITIHDFGIKDRLCMKELNGNEIGVCHEKCFEIDTTPIIHYNKDGMLDS